MKKSILITAAAVAVVLAVVLTAGCIGDNTQQQTTENSTLWMYTDDTGSTLRFITLSPDGTGTFEAYEAETGKEEYKMVTEHGFTWTKEADGTIKILSANEEMRILTMDEKRGLLTSQSGKVYQKIPSELSGQSKTPSSKNQILQGWIKSYKDKNNGEYPPNDLIQQWKEKLGL